MDLPRDELERLRLRNSPAGALLLGEDELPEYDTPEAEERLLRTLRLIVARVDRAKVMGVRDVPVGVVPLTYEGRPFTVQVAEPTRVRRVPMRTIQRIKALQSLGVRFDAWLWADEQEAPLPFTGDEHLRERMPGMTPSPMTTRTVPAPQPALPPAPTAMPKRETAWETFVRAFDGRAYGVARAVLPPRGLDPIVIGVCFTSMRRSRGVWIECGRFLHVPGDE